MHLTRPILPRSMISVFDKKALSPVRLTWMFFFLLLDSAEECLVVFSYCMSGFIFL
jgi:hypothetical protein